MFEAQKILEHPVFHDQRCPLTSRARVFLCSSRFLRPVGVRLGQSESPCKDGPRKLNNKKRNPAWEKPAQSGPPLQIAGSIPPRAARTSDSFLQPEADSDPNLPWYPIRTSRERRGGWAKPWPPKLHASLQEPLPVLFRSSSCKMQSLIAMKSKIYRRAGRIGRCLP